MILSSYLIINQDLNSKSRIGHVLQHKDIIKKKEIFVIHEEKGNIVLTIQF